MADLPPVPKRLQRVEGRGFRIEWNDGSRSDLSPKALRLACPCAACRDEWTGQRTVSEKDIQPFLGIDDARLVGNYAIAFRFSDGHGTGVYTFEYLKSL